MKREGAGARTRAKTKTNGAKGNSAKGPANASSTGIVDEEGTPTKAARTRARVLEATAIVLNREGYAGTKMADISEIAELQAPAIYYHFPSRDAVIEAAVATGQRVTIEYVSNALAELPNDTSPMERILEAATAHLRTTLQWSQFSSASTRCFPQLPLDMQERLEALRVEYGSIWKHLFDEAYRAKAISADLDALSAMMLTLGALNWATEWWDPERGDLAALEKTTRLFIVRALSPGSDSN